MSVPTFGVLCGGGLSVGSRRVRLWLGCVRLSALSALATVVCIDNSDWMINGDYKPSRLQAQAEAVNLLAGAKTGSNPENTVGVLSLAGARGPKVLATPTPDLGRVLSCMQQIKPEGKVSLVAGVQVSIRFRLKVNKS